VLVFALKPAIAHLDLARPALLFGYVLEKHERDDDTSFSESKLNQYIDNDGAPACAIYHAGRV